MAMEVKFAKEINVSEIEYTDVKAYGDNANIVYLNYKGSPIYIQTPSMKCPYGLSKYETDSGKMKYSLDLQLSNDSPSIESLKNTLEEIDNKILDDSVKNSLKWFKKKNQSRDVAQALYTPSIKSATENGEPTDKYPPTIKLKIPYYNDEYKVECFNNQKEKLNSNDLPSYLPKGQMTNSIIRLGGIWFAGKKFGIKWDLVQLKLNPSSKMIEYAFKDDSDDETKQDNSKDDNYVVDSDSDDL